VTVCPASPAACPASSTVVVESSTERRRTSPGPPWRSLGPPWSSTPPPAPAPTGLRTITAAGRAARRPWWLLDAAFPPTVDP